MQIVFTLIFVAVMGLLWTQYADQYFTPANTNVLDSTTENNSVIDDARQAAAQIEGKTRGESVVVYDGVSVPIATTMLDLSNRGLAGSLKAEIRQLAALEELNLRGNKFTGLPAEIGQLSRLKRLNLSNNPLTGLPQEIGNLQQLEVLDLRGTSYSTYDLDVIQTSLPASVQILVD